MPVKHYRIVDWETGAYTVNIRAHGGESYSITVADKRSLEEFRRLLYDSGFIYLKGDEGDG